MEKVSLDCYNSIALSIILDLLNPRRIKKPRLKYGGPSSPVVIVCIADYHQPFISQRSLTSRNLVGVRCRPRCAVRINPIALWYSKHLPWQRVTGLTNFVPSIRPYRNKCSAAFAPRPLFFQLSSSRFHRQKYGRRCFCRHRPGKTLIRFS